MLYFHLRTLSTGVVRGRGMILGEYSETAFLVEGSFDLSRSSARLRKLPTRPLETIIVHELALSGLAMYGRDVQLNQHLQVVQKAIDPAVYESLTLKSLLEDFPEGKYPYVSPRPILGPKQCHENMQENIYMPFPISPAEKGSPYSELLPADKGSSYSELPLKFRSSDPESDGGEEQPLGPYSIVGDL